MSKEGKFMYQKPQPCIEVNQHRRRMTRRPRECSPLIEACTESGRKLRAIEKVGSRRRFVAHHTSKTLEKVKVAFPQKEPKIRKAEDRCDLVPTKSISSSVGSCTVSYSPCRSVDSINDLCGNLVSNSEDIVISASGSEPSIPISDMTTEVHQLELHAYRTTLAAFHASGPISWEREAFMTDLRLMLNISTDEHLFELRNLVSVEAADL